MCRRSSWQIYAIPHKALLGLLDFREKLNVKWPFSMVILELPCRRELTKVIQYYEAFGLQGKRIIFKISMEGIVPVPYPVPVDGPVGHAQSLKPNSLSP